MTFRRHYTAADNVRPPCHCLLCLEAEVTHLEQRCVPDPNTGEPVWLHGQALQDWYDARARVGAQFRDAVKKRGIGGGQ